MAETSVLYCYADIIAEFGIVVEWFEHIEVILHG